MKRVFSALEIARVARERISQYVKALRNRHPEVRASWVEAEKLHLTLQFLASADEADVQALREANRYAGESSQPFILKIAGTGVFPDRGNARVLWLGVEEASEIVRIKLALDKSLAGTHVRSGSKRFKPHLTIARLRSPKSSSDLVEDHLANIFEPVGFEVKRIVLFESVLKPSGSEYSVIDSCNFGG